MLGTGDKLSRCKIMARSCRQRRLRYSRRRQSVAKCLSGQSGRGGLGVEVESDKTVVALWNGEKAEIMDHQSVE